MNIGRPLRQRPDDFEEVFETLGWESCDHYGTNARVIARWADEAGRDRLRRRRRNFVMGMRLSSLKLEQNRV